MDGDYSSAAAVVAGGLALFPGVTLAPDGAHDLSAECYAANGESSSSPSRGYVVDTVPPGLGVRGVMDGQVFTLADDVNASLPGIQFDVCGTTAAADAYDLEATLGAAASNLCVAVGNGSEICVPALHNGSGAQPGACVEVDCGATNPFDVRVTLHDRAGNPSAVLVTGVQCNGG